MTAAGYVPVASRLAMGVCLMLAGGLGSADIVYWQALSTEGRQEPVGVALATMTHEDVGRETVSDDVNITGITIGSEIGIDSGNVFMQAARV